MLGWFVFERVSYLVHKFELMVSNICSRYSNLRSGHSVTFTVGLTTIIILQWRMLRELVFSQLQNNILCLHSLSRTSFYWGWKGGISRQGFFVLNSPDLHGTNLLELRDLEICLLLPPEYWD